MLPEKTQQKIENMETRTLEIIEEISEDVKNVFRVNSLKLNGEIIANISQNQRLVSHLSFYKTKLKSAYRKRSSVHNDLLEKINNGEVLRPDGKKRTFSTAKEKDIWMKSQPEMLLAEARINCFEVVVDHIKALMECCKNKNFVLRYLNSLKRLKD